METQMAELHPQARALLTEARKLPPIYTQSVEDARSRMRAAFVGREPEPIAQVTDISIGDTDRPLRCRAYHPNPTETRPILLFIRRRMGAERPRRFRCPLQHPGQLD